MTYPSASRWGINGNGELKLSFRLKGEIFVHSSDLSRSFEMTERPKGRGIKPIALQ